MDKKIQLEIIWWTITAIVIVLVMFPIWSEVGTDFRYHNSNIMAVFIFMVYSRLLFVLRHTYIAKNSLMKIIFVIMSIPLFIYFMDRINGDTSLLTQYSDRVANLTKYIRYEYLFFAVAALITVAMMPFRMILSLWRTRNRGTV
jgi:hypothetical protein